MTPATHDDPPAFHYEGEDSNAFQAWYFRRMRPLYASMPTDVAKIAEQCDRYVYSLKGWWVWAGSLTGLALLGMLLRTLGVPVMAAIPLALLLMAGLAWHGTLIWLAPTPQMRQQLRQWQAQRNARTKAQLGQQLLGGLLIGAAIGYVGVTFFLKLNGDFSGRHENLDWRGLLSLTLALGLLWFSAQAILSRIRRRQVETWMLEQERRRARDSARADAAEHHLRLLQSQIQPHFLFNTLSTLRFRVDRNPEEAVSMIDELSRYLRAAIKPQGQVRSTLQEELDVIQPYLRLMEARLGKRLRWAVSVPDALLSLTLPTGSLLALVEDALSSAIEPALQGGFLHIQGEEPSRGPESAHCLRVICEIAAPGTELDPVRMQTLQRLQDMAGHAVTFQLETQAGAATDPLARQGVRIEWRHA